MATVEAIRSAIADAHQTGVWRDAQGLDGYSGERLVGALQRLADLQSSSGCYLEVGVYQGLTLISTALATRGRAFGIDNFSQFDVGGRNKRMVLERMELNNVHNAQLVDEDFETALDRLGEVLGGEKVSVYFVDGPHDYRSQIACLQAALPHLSDDAVIIVDDSNYRHVRLANADFLHWNAEFRLLFEAYTPMHPSNMSAPLERAARAGWWNGVNIMIRGAGAVIDPAFPDVPLDRSMSENEHLVQSSKYGFLAPGLVAAWSAALSLRPLKALRGCAGLVRQWRADGATHKGDLVELNTWSDGLPEYQMH